MILLRLRHYGSSDWTEASLDGDLEAELASIFVSRALGVELHVQELRGGEWEDYDD